MCEAETGAARRFGGWWPRRNRLRRRLCVSRLRLGLGLLMSVLVSASAHARTPGESIAGQIALIQADKAARTPVQRKVGSRLLYAARIERGRPAVAGLSELRSDIPVRDGRVEIDVLADVSEALHAAIESLGGRVARRAFKLPLFSPPISSFRSTCPVGGPWETKA